VGRTAGLLPDHHDPSPSQRTTPRPGPPRAPMASPPPRPGSVAAPVMEGAPDVTSPRPRRLPCRPAPSLHGDGLDTAGPRG
jgi:hypothetical protein